MRFKATRKHLLDSSGFSHLWYEQTITKKIWKPSERMHAPILQRDYVITSLMSLIKRATDDICVITASMQCAKERFHSGITNYSYSAPQLPSVRPMIIMYERYKSNLTFHNIFIRYRISCCLLKLIATFLMIIFVSSNGR